MPTTKIVTGQIEGFNAAVDARVAVAPPVAGVATDLSNLTGPTNVSQDLLPNPDNTKALGSQTKRWTSLSTLLVKFYNTAGTFYTGLKAGAATSSVEFVLPIADGTTGQFLKTDGLGNLAFQTVAVPAAGADQTLSNLTAPVAANQDLLPAVTITGQSLGSISKRWKDIWSSVFIASSGQLTMTGGGITLGAESIFSQLQNTLMSFLTFSSGAADAVSTSPISVLTGNKTAGTGNSGAITLQTGTSIGGVRGKVILDGVTIDVSAKKIINLADPTLPQDAATRAFVLANAGGGAPNVVESASSGTQTLVGPINTNIALLSVTITTTGKPVRLGLEAVGLNSEVRVNAASAAQSFTIIYFLRNAVQVRGQRYGVGTGDGTPAVQHSSPASAFSFIDTALAAGTYTYTVQVSTSGTFVISDTKLVAQEIK